MAAGHLAVHQALINRETVLLTMDSNSAPDDDDEMAVFLHAGRSATALAMQ